MDKKSPAGEVAEIDDAPSPLDIDTAEAIIQFTFKGGSVKDVIRLTETFRNALSNMVKGKDKESRIFRDVVTVAFNQLLQALKDRKVTREELDKVGKFCRRAYFLWQAYSKKHGKGRTFTEWLHALKKEAKKLDLDFL